jgi:hypothetical protein
LIGFFESIYIIILTPFWVLCNFFFKLELNITVMDFNASMPLPEAMKLFNYLICKIILQFTCFRKFNRNRLYHPMILVLAMPNATGYFDRLTYVRAFQLFYCKKRKVFIHLLFSQILPDCI